MRPRNTARRNTSSCRRTRRYHARLFRRPHAPRFSNLTNRPRRSSYRPRRRRRRSRCGAIRSRELRASGDGIALTVLHRQEAARPLTVLRRGPVPSRRQGLLAPPVRPPCLRSADFSGLAWTMAPARGRAAEGRNPLNHAGSGSPSGGGGIRTHDRGEPPMPVFKTGAFNRSATPPDSRQS